jgi:phosphate transport system substrate-binding protein
MEDRTMNDVARILMTLVAAMAVGLPGAASAEHGPGGKPSLDPALAMYAPMTRVAGSLRIVGSDTMQPLVNRLAGEFRRRHPDAKTTVQGGGSAGAVQAFIEGPAGRSGTQGDPVMVASSRPLTAAELKRFAARHGYEPTAVPIAVDAVAIYVHRDNPLASLTLGQVDAIFSTTRLRGLSEPLTQWGQLGLEGMWQRAVIRMYGRDEKSGTRGFVKEHVLLNGDFTPAVHEEPGAASVILAVSRDQFGIGYSGIGLQASTVHALALAEHADAPAVAPTAATVSDGSYPLRRLLYLYVDKNPGRPVAPLMQEFLAFAASRDGQETVVRAGFYPISAKQVERELAAVGGGQGY